MPTAKQEKTNNLNIWFFIFLSCEIILSASKSAKKSVATGGNAQQNQHTV